MRRLQYPPRRPFVAGHDPTHYLKFQEYLAIVLLRFPTRLTCFLPVPAPSHPSHQPPWLQTLGPHSHLTGFRPLHVLCARYVRDRDRDRVHGCLHDLFWTVAKDTKWTER